MRICFVGASVLLTGLLALQAQVQQTPWNRSNLIQPQQLAHRLQAAVVSRQQTVLFVGFPVLYRGAHIPQAVLAGPGSKPEGLLALKESVSHLPRSRSLVIYCGCCPFGKCPNVRPAYDALREMGFLHIKVLEIDTNFHTDWVAKGYPVTRGG